MEIIVNKWKSCQRAVSKQVNALTRVNFFPSS